MTTSDPRAEHRDDPGEHRGLGKRILDAVLGEPADARHDDRTTGAGTPAGTPHDPAYDPAGEARRDVGPTGNVDRDEARRDAGYDARDTPADARRDVGDTRYVDDGRRDAGYDDPGARAAGRHPGRDPLAPDAPRDLDAAGHEDRRPADRDTGVGTAAAGATGTTDRGDAGPDFVTGNYDPDRDTGYDPQAADTAVAGRTHADTDADRDTGTAVDYDPTQDTGYVDATRAERDRAAGRRDDDYDTGRVDVDRTGEGRQGERVTTEPAERGGSHGGAGAAAAGVVGAGVAAAAALGSRHRDRSDRSHRSDGDTRFSEVDDTATVDATDTGRGTPDSGAGARAGVADEDEATGSRERLVPADRADDYGRRWDALKGDFVDEPRRAVRQADELVGEVLDELQRLFADQRRGLEQSFDHDQASTEDLRLALRRYRSFFDRLLSL